MLVLTEVGLLSDTWFSNLKPAVTSTTVYSLLTETWFSKLQPAVTPTLNSRILVVQQHSRPNYVVLVCTACLFARVIQQCATHLHVKVPAHVVCSLS